MLQVRDIHVYYDQVHALAGVSIEVSEGEIVAVLGANGAGKSTLLRTISGLVRPQRGEILLHGEPIHRLPPERIVQRGIAHARSDSQQVRADAEELMNTFPLLRERQRELAKMLSGGEQQMLAISRGLMARPRLLLLDEPSLGLAPLLVQDIFGIVEGLRERNVSVLLVEQNAAQALRIADRAYVLVTGEVALQGSSEELVSNEQVRKLYLGEA